MKTGSHVVFAGGGTAGHLFPGLAVAEQLLKLAPELRITFAGGGKSLEREFAAKAGFEYLSLPCRPLPRRAREAIRFLTDNVSGYYGALSFIGEQNVDLVVGLGGFASVPMGRAALSRKIPTVLLEQNAYPGLATRWLSRKAGLVCAAFEETRPHLRANCRLRVTGNPIRKEFAALVESNTWSLAGARLPRKRQLVVLGGSNGSKTLNSNVPLALYKAGAALRGWKIVHQTGERNAVATSELYRKLGLKARVTSFIENMSLVLAHADLAISRAGGTTLAELAMAGVPAIVLPFPKAADDHQRKNADVFAGAGACRMLDERDLAGRLDNHLSKAVADLARDNELRARMALAISRRARPDAAMNVAESIDRLLRARNLVGARAS